MDGNGNSVSPLYLGQDHTRLRPESSRGSIGAKDFFRKRLDFVLVTCVIDPPGYQGYMWPMTKIRQDLDPDCSEMSPDILLKTKTNQNQNQNPKDSITILGLSRTNRNKNERYFLKKKTAWYIKSKVGKYYQFRAVIQSNPKVFLRIEVTFSDWPEIASTFSVRLYLDNTLPLDLTRLHVDGAAWNQKCLRPGFWVPRVLCWV